MYCVLYSTLYYYYQYYYGLWLMWILPDLAHTHAAAWRRAIHHRPGTSAPLRRRRSSTSPTSSETCRCRERAVEVRERRERSARRGRPFFGEQTGCDKSVRKRTFFASRLTTTAPERTTPQKRHYGKPMRHKTHCQAAKATRRAQRLPTAGAREARCQR